jgi:hypothetical protein
LFGEGESDALVHGSGIRRSRVLVLRDGCDFGVDCGLGANNAGQADLARVSLQGTVDQGTCHSNGVVGCFGIGESLVGGLLLQTVEIGYLPSATGRSGISKEAKDRILDLFGIVQVERSADQVEEAVVGVLLRHLTLVRLVSERAGCGHARRKQDRC